MYSMFMVRMWVVIIKLLWETIHILALLKIIYHTFNDTKSMCNHDHIWIFYIKYISTCNLEQAWIFKIFLYSNGIHSLNLVSQPQSKVPVVEDSNLLYKFVCLFLFVLPVMWMAPNSHSWALNLSTSNIYTDTDLVHPNLSQLRILNFKKFKNMFQRSLNI